MPSSVALVYMPISSLCRIHGYGLGTENILFLVKHEMMCNQQPTWYLDFVKEILTRSPRSPKRPRANHLRLRYEYSTVLNEPYPALDSDLDNSFLNLVLKLQQSTLTSDSLAT